MAFASFSNGQRHLFGREPLDPLTNECIRYTARFDDPKLPGTIDVTVMLKAVSVGTEMNIDQPNIPRFIPHEAC